jgi:hypothetical protein
LQIFAVDGFGQNTGTGCFAHPSWSAKQKGMRQGAVSDRIFERSGNMLLTHHRAKGLGPILTSRYNKLFHAEQK